MVETMVPKDKSSGRGDGVGLVEGVREMVMLIMLTMVMEAEGRKVVAGEVVVKMAVVAMDSGNGDDG